MSRRLFVGIVSALIVAGGGVLWWALQGPTTSPPAQQTVDGLRDTTLVGWTDRHTATINATDGADALTALGYVHGMTRAWTVTVWRRTALGTLSATFGDRLAPIDRHVRRLGFSHHARRAYNRLAPSTRTHLRAYTRGLNAALQSDRVLSRAPFVYFDLTPQDWKPWHALALERLLAWTGTDLVASTASADSGLATFRRADRQLRRWLHLHGRTRSVAWAARSASDTTETALFARHVLGSTADPVMQEIALHRPDRASTIAASLPGTPLFPTGTTGGQRWTYLLHSRARLDTTSVGSSRIQRRHERIAPAQSDEELVTIRRLGRRVQVGTAAPGVAWVLDWPGVRAHSDLPRWIGVANLLGGSAGLADTTDFHLFRGEGLTVDAAGTWSVRGKPPVVERSPKSILIGRSSWASHQAEGLRALTRAGGPLAPRRWSTRDSSTWAGSLLPTLLPDLEPISPTDSISVEARSYLRNWNAVYDPASIGAVVFEQWMRAYRNEIGRLPTISDASYFAPPRRRRAFHRAIDTLTRRYGADVRRWRWERVAAERRLFPVWAADSLVDGDLSEMSTTRYAPLDRPGRGHPSSLSGGPSLVDALPLGPAPTRWDGWMYGDTTNLSARRLRFDPSAFFGRSLLPQDRPAPVSVRDAPVTQTTRLVPP